MARAVKRCPVRLAAAGRTCRPRQRAAVEPGAARTAPLGSALRRLLPLALSLGLCVPVPGEARLVTLTAPLTTVVCLAEVGEMAPARLSLTLSIPDDAPADLGVGVWCADTHGRWFQVLHPAVLRPGRQRLDFALDAAAPLRGEPDPDSWDALAIHRTRQVGLLFWSAAASSATLTVEDWRLVAASDRSPVLGAPELRDCELPGHDGVACRLQTGRRWEMRFTVAPPPADPYDSGALAIDLLLRRPDGTEQVLPAFYQEPIALFDGGDREEVRRIAAPGFAVRVRTMQPGRHGARLRLRWPGGEREIPLPDLVASGVAWDEYVRVDPEDPRFFCIGSGPQRRPWWPIGLNIRSVWDLRSHTNAHFTTRLTPDRGSQAYEAFFARLAAAGGDAVEIWLASWNMGLEWRRDWRGYHGLGSYNQENAARLDAVLDAAWRHGIRVNLVIRNHGMVSRKSDRQWPDNPYNLLLGGPAADPASFFTDPRCLAFQQRYRRYLVARYADHPAIMGWKLFSEVNLTAVTAAICETWFRGAAQAWHELDPYGHPVALHWSGDYRTPWRNLCAVPEMDYICIDAYHGRRRDSRADFLAGIVVDGLLHPSRSLAAFAKPVLITEFGGSARACPVPQLLAEHASGPWAACMSGNAGAPMLWWWEWVDQNDHWQPYGALRRFLTGEDLRSRPDSAARAALLHTGDETSWCCAWYRPGRLLGYLADRSWAGDGEAGAARSRTVHIGETVAPGVMLLEWWHADSGEIIRTDRIDHTGGTLQLSSPPVDRHLAFKLYRLGEDSDTGPP